MFITTTATLDVLNKSSHVFIYAEHEVGNYIIPMLITKCGVALNISGATAILQMDKNGERIEEECIVTDNHVQLPITESLTDTCGLFPFQIQLVDGDIKITTITAILNVRKEDGDGV